MNETICCRSNFFHFFFFQSKQQIFSPGFLWLSLLLISGVRRVGEGGGGSWESNYFSLFCPKRFFFFSPAVSGGKEEDERRDVDRDRSRSGWDVQDRERPKLSTSRDCSEVFMMRWTRTRIHMNPYFPFYNFVYLHWSQSKASSLYIELAHYRF